MCRQPNTISRLLQADPNSFTQDTLTEMCVEKRAFYRAVSGLHASINMHVSAIYPRTVRSGLMTSTVWEPNLDMFKHYFSPESTNGQGNLSLHGCCITLHVSVTPTLTGPFWLKNLYFTYLLVQRAVAKAAPLLEETVFYTGNTEDDARTTLLVKDIVASLKYVCV